MYTIMNFLSTLNENQRAKTLDKYECNGEFEFFSGFAFFVVLFATITTFLKEIEKKYQK